MYEETSFATQAAHKQAKFEKHVVPRCQTDFIAAQYDVVGCHDQYCKIGRVEGLDKGLKKVGPRIKNPLRPKYHLCYIIEPRLKRLGDGNSLIR